MKICGFEWAKFGSPTFIIIPTISDRFRSYVLIVRVGCCSQYQPVEIALKTVIERNQQEQVRADCEKLYWEGDLNSLWGSSILD